MNNILLSFLLWVGSSFCLVWGQQAVPYIQADKLLELGAYASYFEDTTNDITAEQVRALPDGYFVDSQDKILNLGFSPSRIWIKWNLQNKTNEPLYAVLEAQDIDFVDAYVVGQDTTYQLETGVLRPFQNRFFATNSIMLYLGRHPRQLYIALKDMNGLVLPVKLGTIRPVVQKVYRETMINSFVVGVMALIALFSLFMFFTLKDRTFLLYALHVVFSALTLLTFEGYLFELLWKDMPYMNNGINSSLIRLGTLLTSVLFSVQFLNLRSVFPRLARFYRVVMALAVGVVAAKILGVQQAEMVFNLIVLVTFISFLVMGVALYRRGFTPARFYLLGWGIYIVEVLLLVLTLFNLITFDHFYTYYGYQLGAVCQATLLMFAVIERINSLRDNIREAQQLAIQRLQEHDELQVRYNAVLEKQIEAKHPEPTSDLQNLLKLMKEERVKVRKIPVPTLEGVLLFMPDDIVRIEAQGSYCTIYFARGKHMVASRSIAEFEQVLAEHDHFFKVHKSHLVNLHYITRYRRGEGGTLLMSDGSEVDVARRVKPDFLKKIGLDG